MADTTSTKTIMSLVATTSSRVRELVIKDGQLIFMQDAGRIAFDYKGKRVFYNQIVELSTDSDRLALSSPLGGYYFVVDEACLWYYRDGWVKITGSPREILFVGTTLPELGRANNLYANTTNGAESLSIWDEGRGEYVVVADKTHDVTDSDILSLFD